MQKIIFRETIPTIKWIIKNENFDFEDIAQIWLIFQDKTSYEININKNSGNG